MKSILGLFLVLGVIFAVSTADGVQAPPATPPKPAAPEAEKQPETQAPQTKRAKTFRFEGTVTAIDVKAGTLKVKSKDGKEQTFVVERRSAKERFDRARVGQVIKVAYQEKDGKFIATGLRGGLGGREPPKTK